MKTQEEQHERHFFGGQAVIEGVLMKGKQHISIAVRKPNKKIKIKLEKCVSATQRGNILGWSFIRGTVNLFEMIIIGMKALTYSANESVDKKEEQLSTWELSFTLFLSFLFAMLLFVVVPYALTMVFGIEEETSSLLFNIVDGALKLFIFFVYLFLIGLTKDIRRIFQYHGAEHQTISCFELGKPLTVQEVRKLSPLHPRCGTSFLLLVIIVGIFLFSFVPFLLTLILPNLNELSFGLRKGLLLSARVLFLVPIAGVSYEVLKLAGKYKESFLLKVLVFPGMLMQKITTRKPDDKQIEVAIAALKRLLIAENVKIVAKN